MVSPLNFVPTQASRPEEFNPKTLIEKVREGYVESADDAYSNRAAIETKMDFFRSFQHKLRQRPRDTGFLQIDDRVEAETIPLLRATMRQEVALFTKNLPKFSLLPRGSGVLQRYQAKLAESFVNSLVTCYPAFFEAIYYGRLLAGITGLAWIKTFWDPEDRTLAPVLGGTTWEYVSRLDAFPNIRCATEKDIYRMYHRKVMPLERAIEMFPVDFEGQPIRPEDFGYNDFRHTSFLSDSQAPFSGTSRTRASTPVEIVEVWMKPSRRLPEGGFIAFTGGKLLSVPVAGGEDGSPEMLTLPDGYWPWTKIMGLNKVPGKLAADGLLHDLIPMQMTINRYASSIKEAVVNSSQNWLLAPREANIQVDDLDDMSGTVIFHDQAWKPAWEQAPGPSAAVMQALDKNTEWYNLTSTQLDAARGVTADNNAKLMAVQSELATALHGPDLTLWANTELAGLCKNTLAAFSNNATEEHYLAMLGPNQQPVFHVFDPETFHPNYQFVIVPGMEAPVSREAQEAKLLEAANAGVFEDTIAAKRARTKMKWLQVDEDTHDPKSVHTSRAEMEQVLFVMSGIAPTLLDRDDDEAHLDTHEPFSVTPEFLGMPPELQQAFLEHMQGHQMQFALKQQNFAGQQQLLGGGKQQPGPAPDRPGTETPWSGGASPGGSETSGDEFSAGEIASKQGPASA